MGVTMQFGVVGYCSRLKKFGWLGLLGCAFSGVSWAQEAPKSILYSDFDDYSLLAHCYVKNCLGDELEMMLSPSFDLQLNQFEVRKKQKAAFEIISTKYSPGAPAPIIDVFYLPNGRSFIGDYNFEQGFFEGKFPRYFEVATPHEVGLIWGGVDVVFPPEVFTRPGNTPDFCNGISDPMAANPNRAAFMECAHAVIPIPDDGTAESFIGLTNGGTYNHVFCEMADVNVDDNGGLRAKATCNVIGYSVVAFESGQPLFEAELSNGKWSFYVYENGSRKPIN